MANVSNVRLGVCSVNFKGADLGHTKGGVTFKYEPMSTEIMVDQYGKTPVDKILNGEKVTVKALLAEFTSKTLGASMPIPNTTVGTGNMSGGANAGQSLRAQAGVLILHPIARILSDLSEDITIRLAVVDSAVEWKYSPEEQRVLDVTFVGLIDESQPVGNRLFQIGVVS